MTAWPEATLSPIARARAVAAGVPGAAWAEADIDAPYREAWDWLTDFETSVPRFDTEVSALRVHERGEEDGYTRVRLTARTGPVPVPFDVRVEDGYCLMKGKARLYVVLMAAEPLDDGARTRFFHCEAVPLPGLARPARALVRRWVAADVRNVCRILEAAS
jgi:hypothetical protein